MGRLGPQVATTTAPLRSSPLEVGSGSAFLTACNWHYSHRTAPNSSTRSSCPFPHKALLLLADTRSRPKREAPITGGRPGSTATRDSTFGRSEREAPRRDRALHDSWQASSSLGGSSSSYRPAAAGRGSRTPPERLASDNGRSSLDHRDSFGPSTSSSSSRGVFRTHSGPPLRDREDFGFGSSASGYHDSLAFKPTAARGTVARGSLDKVSRTHIQPDTHHACLQCYLPSVPAFSCAVPELHTTHYLAASKGCM